jgi:hypothetical protein
LAAGGGKGGKEEDVSGSRVRGCIVLHLPSAAYRIRRGRRLPGTRHLAVQSEYLAKTILSTIHEDLFDELYFLQRYDEFKMELQQLIDMPDKRLSSVIIYLHQNKGIFPNRRKNQFEEITEEEFGSMEKIYKEIFNR